MSKKIIESQKMVYSDSNIELTPPPVRPNMFKGALLAIKQGDIFTKLSALIMASGYFARKQYIKSIILLAYQALVFYFIFAVGFPNLAELSAFPKIGDTKMEYKLNYTTGINEYNDYDNSFTILIFSVITLVAIIVFIASWLMNLRCAYELEVRSKEGEHINNFKEDLKSYLNEKFHITLLTFPVLGVVIFTIVPLIILVAIAFTNYDHAHPIPKELLSWVGFSNFAKLFGSGMTATFGYAFKKVLVWTLVWAFFATFTTYFLGIMLAKFIVNKNTKCKAMWRTFFVVTIAVPQFVTLLVVRSFFADQGIVNNIFSEIGVTDFLRDIGLVSGSVVPFLSSAGWAKVMIILINIWVGVPYQMLIATGVLLNIPQDMLESAQIDGATPWQSFWRITMPYMFAVTGPTLVTDFVRNINNFNVIYLLTQNSYTTPDMAMATSNAKEVDLLVTWLFRLTQEQSNYKMASVIGIFVFIICAIFTLVSFRFLLKGDRERTFQ